MKKVLMVATGGTIASRDHGNGLTPKMNGKEFLPEDIINGFDVDFYCFSAVDSTDIDYKMMFSLAKLIFEKRRDYDAFIVTLGTDTMAYVAAFLNVAIRNLGKPVILTGAMKPFEHPETDAHRNILGTFEVIKTDYQGVGVFMGGLLINAENVSKTNSQSFSAMSVVNGSPDGIIDETGKAAIFNNRKNDGQPSIIDGIDDDVFLIKLTPMTDGKVLEFAKNYRMVIIEAFGEGGLPESLFEPAKKLCLSGTKAYMKTQCANGGSILDKYKVGRRALEAGIMPLPNKTTEHALACIVCNAI